MAILVPSVVTVDGFNADMKRKEYSIECDVLVGGENLLIFNFKILEKNPSDKVKKIPFSIVLKEQQGELFFVINKTNAAINTIYRNNVQLSCSEHLIHCGLELLFSRIKSNPSGYTVIDNSVLLLKSVMPYLETVSIGTKNKGMDNVLLPIDFKTVLPEWAKLSLTNPSTEILVKILLDAYKIGNDDNSSTDGAKNEDGATPNDNNASTEEPKNDNTDNENTSSNDETTQDDKNNNDLIDNGSSTDGAIQDEKLVSTNGRKATTKAK